MFYSISLSYRRRYNWPHGNVSLFIFGYIETRGRHSKKRNPGISEECISLTSNARPSLFKVTAVLCQVRIDRQDDLMRTYVRTYVCTLCLLKNFYNKLKMSGLVFAAENFITYKLIH